MSKLSIALDAYLNVRRALGYKLHAQGCLLQQFVEFADRAGAGFITAELALQWAMQSAQAQPIWRARRLGMVRQSKGVSIAGDCVRADPALLH
jgi:integrase/recombinase XerD